MRFVNFDYLRIYVNFALVMSIGGTFAAQTSLAQSCADIYHPDRNPLMADKDRIYFQNIKEAYEGLLDGRTQSSATSSRSQRPDSRSYPESEMVKSHQGIPKRATLISTLDQAMEVFDANWDSLVQVALARDPQTQIFAGKLREARDLMVSLSLKSLDYLDFSGLGPVKFEEKLATSFNTAITVFVSLNRPDLAKSMHDIWEDLWTQKGYSNSEEAKSHEGIFIRKNVVKAVDQVKSVWSENWDSLVVEARSRADKTLEQKLKAAKNKIFPVVMAFDTPDYFRASFGDGPNPHIEKFDSACQSAEEIFKVLGRPDLAKEIHGIWANLRQQKVPIKQ